MGLYYTITNICIQRIGHIKNIFRIIIIVSTILLIKIVIVIIKTFRIFRKILIFFLII